MSDNVYLKSGEQPRNFGFGIVNGAQVTTTTTVSNSAAIPKESPHATYQAILTSATNGATVSATIAIQVTNEELTGQGVNSNWITLGTISLTGTINTTSGPKSFTDGFNSIGCPWRFSRAAVTAIAGTGATVSVIMGV